MTQVSLGFQLGGQAYSEIVFLETRQDLIRFESGRFALGAQASPWRLAKLLHAGALETPPPLN
jgi:lipid-binding SYLF domain-containing protein